MQEQTPEQKPDIESMEKQVKDIVPSPRGLPAEYDPLQIFLREIRKIPLLSPQEEEMLAIRYKENGDMESAYTLVKANLRLVVKIALEYQRQWMSNLMDLIQEGNLGLIQAVKNFDPHRGVKLSYYASYWIKAYMIKFIMDNWRLVKIGTTQMQRKLFFNLQKEKTRLEKMGFYSGPARLAESFGTDEYKIIEMQQRMGDWEASLSQPVGDDWKETRGDMLSSDEEIFDEKIANHEFQELFNKKLDIFKKGIEAKELDILENRLLADPPATLQDIGNRYGITKERVRQLENRLKSKIKTYMEEQLHDFDQLEIPEK